VRTTSRRSASLLSAALLAVPPVLASAGAHGEEPLCVVDMGSNSFKRIVGSFENGRYLQRSLQKKTLGVGDDLERNGRISDAKLAEIAATLASFRMTCTKEGVERVVAVGTAAFREAPNGADVVAAAARLGIPMEIATEKRESELAYLVGSLGRDDCAVIDNGSRSIELVSKVAGREPRYTVLGLGYRVAYERFFAAADDAGTAVRELRARLLRDAGAAAFMRGRERLVGVEFEEMTELLFAPAAAEGRVLTLAELQQKLDAIARSGADEFDDLKRKRDIDRALPRLVVAATLTEAFGYSALELTARELGSGLIIEAGIARAAAP
jgi:exopolyphosphatase/guanosine-5'-triphosphate,3'-diphosphate pyrophosphatase